MGYWHRAGVPVQSVQKSACSKVISVHLQKTVNFRRRKQRRETRFDWRIFPRRAVASLAAAGTLWRLACRFIRNVLNSEKGLHCSSEMESRAVKTIGQLICER